MRLRLVGAVIALVVCSAAHAECICEILGDIICGQGPCSNDQNGELFCATERYGTAVQDGQGDVVCGLGSCVEDILS